MPSPHYPDQRVPGTKSFTVALAGFCVLLALFVFSQSSFFRLEHIEVQGAEQLGDPQIKQLSGIRLGVNVFHVDVAAAVDRLKADPRIADARIARRLPAGIVIAVRVRQPVAVVAGPSAKGAPFYEVDQDGRVLAPASSTDVAGLPLISAAGSSPPATLAPGDVVLDPNLKRAAQVAGQVSAELPGRAARIDVVAADNVRLILRDKTVIALGTLDKLSKKLSVLSALLQQVDKLGLHVATVDVSSPREPVVSKRS